MVREVEQPHFSFVSWPEQVLAQSFPLPCLMCRSQVLTSHSTGLERERDSTGVEREEREKKKEREREREQRETKRERKREKESERERERERKRERHRERQRLESKRPRVNEDKRNSRLRKCSHATSEVWEKRHSEDLGRQEHGRGRHLCVSTSIGL